MTIRALFCGGVKRTCVVAWGNHIPVTHREFYNAFKWNIKACVAAGFLELKDNVPQLHGESISLRIDSSSPRLRRLPEFFESYQIWVCMVEVGHYEIPVLFMGSYEPDFFPKKKLIDKSDLNLAVDKLYDLGVNRTDREPKRYNYLNLK